MDKWDLRYLDLAKFIATWSKDPSKQIGAVAIGSRGQVLAQGSVSYTHLRAHET